MDFVRSGEKGDLAVTQLQQVVNCGTNARGVIEQNGARLWVLEVKLSQHQRDVVK